MSLNLSRRDFLRTASVAAAVAAVPAIGAESDKPVTLALVGCAHIHTPGFVDLLKRRKDVKVKSVWDHDPARAEKRAKQLNAQVVTDVQEIWRDPEVPGVVICSET